MPHGAIYAIRKEGLDSDPHSFPILTDAWNRNRSRYSLTVTIFLQRGHLITTSTDFWTFWTIYPTIVDKQNH